MKTFITLLNWTQKGIQEYKESPMRVDKAREVIEKNGGKMKSFYMTMGRYDMVSVIETPDDETYAKIMLALVSRGGVRTETLMAFPEDQYRQLIAATGV